MTMEVNNWLKYKLLEVVIIPMDAAMIGDFNKGNSISQTAERTRLRGIRRFKRTISAS